MKYDKYIEYANRLSDPMRSVMLKGVNELDIEYDEIWIDVNDHLFNKSEKQKYKGSFDISKLYWKNDQIQAATVEKQFVGDPTTGKQFAKPAHKIVYIFDRQEILKEIRK